MQGKNDVPLPTTQKLMQESVVDVLLWNLNFLRRNCIVSFLTKIILRRVVSS